MNGPAFARRTMFTSSGGVDIAYQVVDGGGTLDVVVICPWVSHLEVMWELSEFAAFLDRLANLGRLIIIDKRGTGLSDRTAAVATLEDHVNDLRQVLQAVGARRVAITAWGDGAAIALMFAATNPEQVGALVLGGVALEANGAQSTPFVPDPGLLKVMASAVEADWGKGTFGALMAPSLATDERFLSWHSKYERVSATPNAAAAMLRWMLEIDLTSILASVQAPTLVINRSGSPWPAEPARALAAKIKNGVYVELPGDDAMPFVGDTESYLGEIEEFLTGSRGRPDLDRALATVLFTDIVASTEIAHRLGDRRWRYLLEEHNNYGHRLIERFKGAHVATTGDGFVATFDGPGRAVRCACAIRDAVRALGLEVRAGLHTGEVEQRGTGVLGLAVHIGARVAALARANEVLVTSTVQALVLGSGITFADRGTHLLKGVPDRWQLFAVESL